MKKDRYSFDPVITNFMTHPKKHKTMKSVKNWIFNGNDFTVCLVSVRLININF